MRKTIHNPSRPTTLEVKSELKLQMRLCVLPMSKTIHKPSRPTTLEVKSELKL